MKNSLGKPVVDVECVAWITPICVRVRVCGEGMCVCVSVCVFGEFVDVCVFYGW